MPYMVNSVSLTCHTWIFIFGNRVRMALPTQGRNGIWVFHGCNVSPTLTPGKYSYKPIDTHRIQTRITHTYTRYTHTHTHTHTHSHTRPSSVDYTLPKPKCGWHMCPMAGGLYWGQNIKPDYNPCVNRHRSVCRSQEGWPPTPSIKRRHLYGAAGCTTLNRHVCI